MTNVATVSYLNARPLIEGLEDERGIEIIRRVPSRLLETLESGTADIALCPVIDFQISSSELVVVPSGAIGCDGPALTVKLFSRNPVGVVDEIAIDGDSHTSVALLRVIMSRVYGRQPSLRPLSDRNGSSGPESLLLIGDKVITDAPDGTIYPHELDLGEAWRAFSGRPFVFATWMAPSGTDLGDLPNRLDRVRRANRDQLPQIAARHADASGWPENLALNYLSRHLRFRLGPAELAGMEDFWEVCHEDGIIDELRPLRLYRG